MRFPAFLPLGLLTSQAARCEFVGEPVFQKLLGYERRRAMRSGRSFLLMLVNVEDLLHADPGEHLRSKLVSALSECTRETDVVGWYREGASIGIIFADIRLVDGSAPENVLCAKVGEALDATFGGDVLKQIRIKFVVLPEAAEFGSRRLSFATSGEAQSA